MNVLVTGGAGFIGSALVRYIASLEKFQAGEINIFNIDKLTYAGNLRSLSMLEDTDNHYFLRADICDQESISKAFHSFAPQIVFHLAAESHVDRSISNSDDFVRTNILGTYTLLEVARTYWQRQRAEKKRQFRFVHVSTDEVFGALMPGDAPFSESSPYQPNSPYSATKAGSDHLVRSWHHTYGFPSIITNCSNNYGPYQFPEKLIPLTILNALEGNAIPVFGEGKQIRDWLYVDDHVDALWKIAQGGQIGKTYNVGSNNEQTNIDLVKRICGILDEFAPVTKDPAERKIPLSYSSLISFVKDRPGHDFRYSINSERLQNTLNWKAQTDFETGLRKTIEWYMDNLDWVKSTKQSQSLSGEVQGAIES